MWSAQNIMLIPFPMSNLVVSACDWIIPHHISVYRSLGDLTVITYVYMLYVDHIYIYIYMKYMSSSCFHYSYNHCFHGEYVKLYIIQSSDTEHYSCHALLCPQGITIESYLNLPIINTIGYHASVVHAVVIWIVFHVAIKVTRGGRNQYQEP